MFTAFILEYPQKLKITEIIISNLKRVATENSLQVISHVQILKLYLIYYWQCFFFVEDILSICVLSETAVHVAIPLGWMLRIFRIKINISIYSVMCWHYIKDEPSTISIFDDPCPFSIPDPASLYFW